MNEATEHAWNFQREMPHVHPPDRVSVQSEPPHPLVTALEGLLTKIRWRFDALLEKWHGLVMAHKEHRIDPDFNPNENDIRIVRQAIDQLRLAGNYYNGDRGGGSESRVLNWILGAITLLVVGAVGGEIAVYGRVNSLEATVASLQQTIILVNNSNEARIRRLEDINERRYRGANNE